ncbi:hypothetical protein EJ07DRAFT_174932 [Lizonia empirigonia]|nr:hypothetical protein EJ07DRAFT_174932 [Lizonia empirigonia]
MAIPVRFRPADTYSKQPEVRDEIISIVQNLEDMPEEATRAIVVNGWHTSKSDQKYLITVDYFKNNKLLERVHISAHSKKRKSPRPTPPSAPSSATSSGTES